MTQVPKAKILIVDDDVDVSETYAMVLSENFAVETASSGQSALELIARREPYQVVIADMGMPGMNGTQFLIKFAQRSPDTVRMMLTGDREQKTAASAVNETRVFRFLSKPSSAEAILQAVADAARHYELMVAERELLEKTLKGSVAVLTEMVSMSDPALLVRTQKLRAHVSQICSALNLADIWEIDVAVMVLNIGATTVPPEVLLKARRGDAHTKAEQDILKRLPAIGSALLAKIPRLEGVARIVHYQSKHFDGTGFPVDNVAGLAIPLGARIIKVASDRLKLELKGSSPTAITEEMGSRIGWYDTKILEAAHGVTRESAVPFGSNCSAIKFSDLKVGQKLGANLETVAGVMLVSSGYVITESLLERVHNFAATAGVKEPIYIENSFPRSANATAEVGLALANNN